MAARGAPPPPRILSFRGNRPQSSFLQPPGPHPDGRARFPRRRLTEDRRARRSCETFAQPAATVNAREPANAPATVRPIRTRGIVAVAKGKGDADDAGNAMRVIGDFDELRELVDQELGTSDWISVTQEMIDGFAGVTGDHQWIHVDVPRAEAESPYGGTIAHGYLTLSLLPQMVYRIYRVDGARQSINYGLDKLRFPAAVRAGARLRTTLRLLKVDPVEPDGVRLTNRATMEIEGEDKPACVAETVTVFFR